MSRVLSPGNYFELPDASVLSLPVQAGLSITAWVKYDVTGDLSLRRGAYQYNDEGGATISRISLTTAYNREVRSSIYDKNGYPRNTPNSERGETVPEDVWFPFVVSVREEDNYGGRLVHPYLQSPLTPTGGDTWIHSIATPEMRIGAEVAGWGLRGKMAHFTIYGRGLTDDEIDNILAGRHPLTIDGVAHYWPMTEGTGDIVDLINGVTVPMVGTVGEDVEDNPPVDTIVLPEANLAVTITGLPPDTLLYGWLAQWV
jgi:hypothetical protein